MKKFVIATVAAAGLISLGACGTKTDNNPAAANLEAAADNMDEMADNMSGNAEDMVENQADNLHAMADNAGDADKNGATNNPATGANVAVGNAMGAH